MPEQNEQAWAILGNRYQHWAWGRLEPLASGTPTSVAFEEQPLLARFEEKRDLLGFAHTHPNFSVLPSQTDYQTLKAWSLVLGRPLLGLIFNQKQSFAAWFNYRFEQERQVTVLRWGSFCLFHF